MWWRKKPAQHQGGPLPWRCSFCNKWQHDEGELIAGPGEFICDECVEVCNDILAEAKRLSSSAEAPRLRSEEPITWPNSIECALCHTPIRKDDGVVIAGNRGTLCVDCVKSVASQYGVDRN
jgi:hypothetical protein